MSAELPLFERKVTRREFLRSGIAATIYLSPLLSACQETSPEQPPLKLESEPVPEKTFSLPEKPQIIFPRQEEPSPQEIFPERTKFFEIIPWKEENPSSLKEIEKGTFLFGFLVSSDKEKKKVLVKDLPSGLTREFNLPDNPADFYFEKDWLSPDRQKLLLVGLGKENQVNGTKIYLLDLEENKIRPVFEEKITPAFTSFSWSSDSNLFLINMIYPERKLWVVEQETGKVVYETEGKFIGDGFSPHEQGLALLEIQYRAEPLEGLRGFLLSPFRGSLEFIDFSTGKTFRQPLPSEELTASYCWSPDGRLLASLAGPANARLSIWNPILGQKETFVNLGRFWNLRFCPDSRRLFLFSSEESGKLHLFDPDSGQVRLLFENPNIYFLPFLPPSNSYILSENELIFLALSQKRPEHFGGFWEDVGFYYLNIKTGELRLVDNFDLKDKKDKGYSFSRFLSPNLVLFSTSSQWFIYSLSEKKVSPLVAKKPEKITTIIGPRAIEGENLFLEVLQEGETIKQKTLGELFYFTKGRKYPLGSFASGFLGEKRKEVSRRVFNQIPESENKLFLQGGDMAMEQGGKTWYLREKGKYLIQDPRKFLGNTRFDRKIWEVPPWVVEKMIEGEGFSRGKEFFQDWDGREIETQPEGGLMILFFAGFGSSSESQKKTFGQIIEKLKEIGWRDSQILFPTYNIQVTADQTGSKLITPDFYTSEHSLRFVPENREAMANYLQRLKLLCPRTRFLLCGHSQGGDMAFYTALRHPDAVCQVVTINSPLGGVEKTLLPELLSKFVELEDLAFLRLCQTGIPLKEDFLDKSCEAIRFYVAEGDSPTLKPNLESWAAALKRQKVELFTFSAVNDPLVRSKQAILEQSDNQIDGEEIKLLWEAPQVSGHRSAHGALLDHKPFVKQLVEKVIGPP